MFSSVVGFEQKLLTFSDKYFAPRVTYALAGRNLLSALNELHSFTESANLGLSLDVSSRFYQLISLYVRAMLIVTIRVSSSPSVANEQCLADLQNFLKVCHNKPGLFALLDQQYFWLLDEIFVLLDDDLLEKRKRFGRDDKQQAFATEFEQGFIDAVFEYIEEFYHDADWRLLGTDSVQQGDVSVVTSLSDSGTENGSGYSTEVTVYDSIDEEGEGAGTDAIFKSRSSDHNLVDQGNEEQQRMREVSGGGGQQVEEVELEMVVKEGEEEEEDYLFGMLSPWSVYTVSDHEN